MRNRWIHGAIFLLVIGFVGNAASISSFILNLYPQWVLVIATLFLFLILISVYVLFRQQQYNWQNKLKDTADAFHNVSHYLRNKHDEFGWPNLSKDPQLQNQVESDKKGLQQLTEAVGERICNYISETLRRTTENEVCACIKILEPNEPHKPRHQSNLDEARTVTLCRSSNSPRERFDPVEQPLRGNTDFEVIREGQNYFFGLNLDKKLADLEYKNSSSNWTKFYKSTVVVPIRIKLRTEGQKDIYDLLGFLCVDSKDGEAFHTQLEIFYTEMLMAVADQLYHFFDFIYHLRENGVSLEAQGID